MTHPILITEQLAIGYAPRRGSRRIVAANLNLRLHCGEMVCLLGPNGAGKSTLLRTLTGIQPPLAGRIWLDGRDLHTFSARELARRLSVVLTERVETGPLTAYALVALGRHPYTSWHGQLTVRDEEVVRWAITAVQATHLAARPLHELSDGERQRIMIARALAQEPIVMALDEPTAFLDLPRRVEVMQLLRRLAQETQRAIIVSTHDLDLALHIADMLWLLTSNGSFYAGAPEDLVISGALATTFAHEGIVFDQQRGQFRIDRPAQRQATLTGNGIIRYWTAQALERAGWRVVAGGETELHIVITGDDHQPSWDIYHDGVKKQQMRSLYATIHWLRQQYQEEHHHERHA